MAPKKEKTEKVTGDQATEKILDYLRAQNRPYSITEIVANLHNTVSKANVTKALKELCDSGDVVERISGKAAVYHMVQDPKDTISEEEIKKYEAEIETLAKETAHFRRKLKDLESTLTSLRNAPSSEVLETELSALKSKTADYERQISVLKSGNVEMASAEEMENAEKALEAAVALRRRREKVWKELWGMVCDGCEERPEKLADRLGLDL